MLESPLQVPATKTEAGAWSMATGVLMGVVAAAAPRLKQRRCTRTPHCAVSKDTAVVEKPDLTGVLPDCPSTIWKADDIDIENLPAVAETAPLLIDAAELGTDRSKEQELAYFVGRRQEIMDQLQRHGAIWFRNFEMKKDAVYEAVNKPSLAQHFVGLHNESTFVKTAMFGAFVCFKPATEGGGEFIVADGAKIINDMDKDVLRRLYERKVRISVSNLDLNFVNALPDGIKEGVKDSLQELILGVVAPKFDMDLEMVYGA